MRKIIKSIRDTLEFTVYEYIVDLDPNRNSTEQLVTFLIKKLFTPKFLFKVKIVLIYIFKSKIIIKVIKLKKQKTT